VDEARVIENSRQSLKSYQISGISLPQKLGEVIAQVHFLASTAFLQYRVNGDVPYCIGSKALLIDKMTGDTTLSY